MTIMEMPRRVREAARLSAGRLVARFLEPLLFRQRKRGTRLQLSSRSLDWRPEIKGAIPAAEIIAGGNAPLSSLAEGTLAQRFHAWCGASGRRYICSVFPVDRAAADAGLPDYVDAIALAVTCNAEGSRRCLSLLVTDEELAEPVVRQQFIAAALAAGAIEWHVHLLAADAQQRRLVSKDITAGRLAHSSAPR